MYILYAAFVDLEKALDQVFRDAVWLALRKLGVESGWLRLYSRGCPEELLYVDYLILFTKTLEGLIGRLEHPKGALESKELRVNVK